jgi:hypothetical protein
MGSHYRIKPDKSVFAHHAGLIPDQTLLIPEDLVPFDSGYSAIELRTDSTPGQTVSIPVGSDLFEEDY